jgi:hypothetical protein
MIARRGKAARHEETVPAAFYPHKQKRLNCAIFGKRKGDNLGLAFEGHPILGGSVHTPQLKTPAKTMASQLGQV